MLINKGFFGFQALILPNLLTDTTDTTQQQNNVQNMVCIPSFVVKP